jgi:hypothetical protein
VILFSPSRRQSTGRAPLRTKEGIVKRENVYKTRISVTPAKASVESFSENNFQNLVKNLSRKSVDCCELKISLRTSLDLDNNFDQPMQITNFSLVSIFFKSYKNMT